VQLLHKKALWKFLHFAFIIPAIIIGNSLRIVFTVALFQISGEVVLQGVWHIVLGYVQIIFAIIVFLAFGKIFSDPEPEPEVTK
jgi:exosortase/archaeosortase family protein